MDPYIERRQFIRPLGSQPMPTAKEPEYLTVAETAELLRISKRTLQNRMSLDKINAQHGKRRIGRMVIFDRAVLKRALDNGDLA
jgi:hypothetical protein